MAIFDVDPTLSSARFISGVVVIAGLVAVACTKPAGQAAPKELPVTRALASAVPLVHTDPVKTEEEESQDKPAVAVLPWACPAFFESSLVPGLRAVWSRCPVAPPMESPAGLCTEAPCLRPCEYLSNGRVSERYAYVDGRLAGSWDTAPGSGEVYATSRMLYDAEGRLVSEIGKHHYVDLKYQGGRVVHVIHQGSVRRREYTYQYDELGRPAQRTQRAFGSERRVTTAFVWEQDRLVSEISDATWKYDSATYRYVPVEGRSITYHEYDAQGYPSCIVGDGFRRCFEYDERRRVSGIGHHTSIEYDELDRPSKRTSLTQVTEEKEVQVIDTWRYNCKQPAKLAKVFTPISRAQVAECVPRCQEKYRKAFPEVGNNFRVSCRKYCEGVGRIAPPPSYE